MTQLDSNIIDAIAQLQEQIGHANHMQGFHKEGNNLRAVVSGTTRYEGKPETAADAALRNYRITKFALMMTEASEAIEELRHGRLANETYYLYDDGEEADSGLHPDGSPRKPEGVPSELADIFIRVIDFAFEEKINLGAIVAEKLAYNATRPYRHGKKV